MTTATSNSQAATVGTTAVLLSWPQFFASIVIENLGTVLVWVATDGSTAVAGAQGLDVVPPNSTAVFSNRAPLPDVTQPGWPGSTMVSLVTASGAAEVVVSPQ